MYWSELVGLRVLTSKRFVPCRIESLHNGFASKIVFGSQRIVRRTTQREIGREVPSTFREWSQVVKLQVVRLAAAFAALIDVTAAATVALKHLAPDGCRDVAASGASREARVAVLDWRVRFTALARWEKLALTALARYRHGLTALARRLPRRFAAALPTRSRLRRPEPALLERSDEQSHRLQVQLTQAHPRTAACPKRFGALDKLRMLFAGAELYLIMLRPGHRGKVSRHGPDWQRFIRKGLLRRRFGC